jgi:hypothetical protein
MDMDQAAVFLAASILVMTSLIVIVAGAVFINNIIFRYWKSFGWKFFSMWIDQSQNYAQPSELDKSKEPKV